MTKRNLIVLLALGALVNTNAFASRARLLVMGTGDPVGLLDGTKSSGSLYYDDQYNIFYNPSYVNDFKNWGTIEKSNYVSGTGATQVGTTAQGGFVASVMNMNVGLYFNRVEATSSAFTFRDDMRPIDLLIGGDMGVKWGVGAHIATTRQNDNQDMDLNLKAGVQVADLEPFVAFRVGAKEKTSGTDRKVQGFSVGTRYKFGEWIPYAVWRQNKVVEDKDTNWGIGFGRNAKLAENARLVYTTGFFRAAHQGRNIIPVDFALEGDAVSWLTLRAGLGFRVWDRTSKTSNGDATTGRVGATIHAGKADFDWGVGTNTGITDFGQEGSSLDAQSLGISQNFFTAASLTYRW